MASYCWVYKNGVTSVGLKQELKINHVFWLTHSVANQVQFNAKHMAMYM